MALIENQARGQYFQFAFIWCPQTFYFPEHSVHGKIVYSQIKLAINLNESDELSIKTPSS